MHPNAAKTGIKSDERALFLMFFPLFGANWSDVKFGILIGFGGVRVGK